MPLFLDIIKIEETFNVSKYDNDHDYFFKFKGKKEYNQKCPICNSNDCTMEVKEGIEYINNIKCERAYLKFTCNNRKDKKDGEVEEKELREELKKMIEEQTRKQRQASGQMENIKNITNIASAPL